MSSGWSLCGRRGFWGQSRCDEDDVSSSVSLYVSLAYVVLLVLQLLLFPRTRFFFVVLLCSFALGACR